MNSNFTTSPAAVQTDHQRNRFFIVYLSAWIVAHARASGGPVATMFERIQTAGHLPAMPGLAHRVGRIVALEGRRTDEISAQILPDMAFSFELLRRLNTAQVQITQISDNGPVLTLRSRGTSVANTAESAYQANRVGTDTVS